MASLHCCGRCDGPIALAWDLATLTGGGGLGLWCDLRRQCRPKQLLNAAEEYAKSEGLLQELAVLRQFHVIPIAGDEQNRCFRTFYRETLTEHGSIHARHHEITNDEIDFAIMFAGKFQ